MVLLYLVVIHEFCRISVEFLKKGINAKVYQTASRECSLRFSQHAVHYLVVNLCYLILK